MQATVIPFPPLMRLRSVVDVAGDPGRSTTADPAAASRELAGPGLAANLLLAAAPLLTPGAVDIRATLALLLAALAFSLLDTAGAALPGLGRRLPTAPAWPSVRAVGAALFALGCAAVVGPGLVTALVAFLVVEACRYALAAVTPRPLIGVGLVAAGLVLRFDAGAIALGLEPAPQLLAAGCLLAIFLALALQAAPPTAVGRGRRRDARGLGTDVVLLALAAGVTALYAAALLGDPRLVEAAGVWPLATVPLVVAGLVRVWRTARANAAEASSRPAPWLIGTGAAWAGLLLFLVGAG
jgi:hypothetical protein